MEILSVAFLASCARHSSGCLSSGSAAGSWPHRPPPEAVSVLPSCHGPPRGGDLTHVRGGSQSPSPARFSSNARGRLPSIPRPARLRADLSPSTCTVPDIRDSVNVPLRPHGGRRGDPFSLHPALPVGPLSFCRAVSPVEPVREPVSQPELRPAPEPPPPAPGPQPAPAAPHRPASPGGFCLGSGGTPSLSSARRGSVASGRPLGPSPFRGTRRERCALAGHSPAPAAAAPGGAPSSPFSCFPPPVPSPT